MNYVHLVIHNDDGSPRTVLSLPEDMVDAIKAVKTTRIWSEVDADPRTGSAPHPSKVPHIHVGRFHAKHGKKPGAQRPKSFPSPPEFLQAPQHPLLDLLEAILSDLDPSVLGPKGRAALQCHLEQKAAPVTKEIKT